MTTIRQKQFTGWHMLAILVAFFSVVIGVNITLAVFSACTWTGLVVENSYVESQLFNGRQHQLAAQKAAGWTVRTGYDNGRIDFVAHDKVGTLLELQAVSAFVHRPVGGHDDATIDLVRREDAYSGELVLPEGVWDVTVTTGDTALGPIVYETRIKVE